MNAKDITARAMIRAIDGPKQTKALIIEALELALDELNAIADGNPELVEDSTLDKIAEALRQAR